MAKTETLCLELCRQLLDSSGFDGNDFVTKSFENENDAIVLEASNGICDIIFNLASKVYQDGTVDENFFYFKEGDHVTCIENINVRGYHSSKFSQLNQKQLLSLVKNLAIQHSNFVSVNNKEVTSNEGNVFQSEENQKALESLYKLPALVDTMKADISVFKQGIDQMIANSKELLQPGNKKFYISGSIFHRKLIFKDDDDEYADCMLFKLQKGRPVSIVYDMLSLIYLITDQEQRQKYFHEITDYYYHVLKDNLNDLDVDLPLHEYEKEIKAFIPYVKLELVCFYIKQLFEETKKDIVDIFSSNNEYKELICELVLELYEYVKAPRINREDCFKIVKEAMGTNYENLSYELTKLDGLLGLIGEYYKLKITVNQTNNDRVFNLFAKFVPLEFEGASYVFLREEFFYTTFMSELRKVGLEDITDFLPKCYFVRQADVMVFEDMSHSNYTAGKGDESFSYEMLQLVVETFARMHACSLLYEEITTKKTGKDSRIYDKYSDYVGELIYVKGVKFAEVIINCGIDSTVNYVFDQFPDIPKQISMETFRERARKLFDLMIQKFQVSKQYRNVVCHGDIWGGNILFKFDGTDPSDCCFVDYQLIRYCPPTHDLLAFLYINTDKATRTKYMSKLLDHYFNELSAIFKKYDFDLNKIYPYDHYIDCCNHMKSQAVCLAALTYPNSLDRGKLQSLLPEEKMRFITMDKSEILEELFKENRFRARFREIVEDLYELCLENDLKID